MLKTKSLAQHIYNDLLNLPYKEKILLIERLVQSLSIDKSPLPEKFPNNVTSYAQLKDELQKADNSPKKERPKIFADARDSLSKVIQSKEWN